MERKDSEAMQMLDLNMEQLSLIDVAQENDDLIPSLCDYVFPEFSPAKLKRKCHDARTIVDGQENKETANNTAAIVNQQSTGKPVSTKLPPLIESPGTTKKNYLRQSLPWHPAFLTEPGLLDENELIAYTNMKPKQDLGTSNATKNEVGAHSNSTVVKDKKLKANFLKKRSSCVPRASIATPQQQADRTHLPSHKRATYASVISLQNPSQDQVVGKDNWRSPLGKSLYSGIRRAPVGSSVLLDKNQKHKKGLSSLSLSNPSAFQNALSSQTPHTFLRKGGGVRFSKKVNSMEKDEQKQKHACKEHFHLEASSPIMMTNNTSTKTVATQPNKDAEKKTFLTKAFARKFTSVSKTVKNTLGQVLPGNKSKNAPLVKELPRAPQDNLSCNPTSMANASSSTDKLVALNRCPTLNPVPFEPYSRPKPRMTTDSNLQKPDSTTIFSTNEHTSDEISGRASLVNQSSSISYNTKVKRRCRDARTTVDGQENKETATAVNQQSYGKPISTKLQLLTESPGIAKENYLRQSLPWHPAFFTEPGLLDENELIAYTNMKSKQDPRTSNATKNEVGAHSNSTVVKDKKLKANFSKTKSSCAPCASIATPQQQANRTHLLSHERAPSTSIISLQNPSQGQVVGKDNGHLSSHKRAPFASGISLQNASQLVGKDNWHSPIEKSLYSDIRIANEPASHEISGRASLMNQSSIIYYNSNPSLKKELFAHESFKYVETSGQSMSIGKREGIVAAAVAGNSSMKNTNGSRPSGLRMPSLKMGFFDIKTWFYL